MAAVKGFQTDDTSSVIDYGRLNAGLGLAVKESPYRKGGHASWPYEYWLLAAVIELNGQKLSGGKGIKKHNAGSPGRG